MANNLAPFYISNEKRGLNLKSKKEDIISSLFEVEKFLCRINTTKKCSCFAKMIKNC